MDIHRCRFVPYPASTINVLAFSHSQSTKEKKAASLRLAIGRANGDIEIWNPLRGAWLQETILRGGRDRSVDGLVWIQDPEEDDGDGKRIDGRLRLFSVGYSSTITEWDLERGQPKQNSSGNHGEIWCIAAQPPVKLTEEVQSEDPALRSQYLVTGCTDGAVALYSTADGELRLQRILVRPSAKKAKVISIAFQDRYHVVAGCTDSTIRIYDIRNGSLIRSMSLGVGPAGGPREIIVWAVKCLPNGNIVSGDSTGEMRIWDGKTYTLTQRIKSHRQDILSVATNVDGSIIFTGGMDRRTTVYKQISGSKSRWAEVSHRRFHSHDVKTMSTFEGDGMSVLASGGPDASPIIVPIREFGMEFQRALPYLPQDPVSQSAPGARLVVSFWDREVNIWRIKKLSKSQPEPFDSDMEGEEQSSNRKLVAKVVVKGEANITAASITGYGRLLAVSTAEEVKVFKLKARPTHDGESLRVSKLEVPPRLSLGGARTISFSPDGHWLAVVRRDNRIVLARVRADSIDSIELLPKLSKLKRLDRGEPRAALLGGLGAYDRSITRVAFSADSRIFAAADLAGYVDTWVLDGVEAPEGEVSSPEDDASSSSSSDSDSDSEDDDEERKGTVLMGQQWIPNPSASLLPKLPSAAVVLSFRPSTNLDSASKSTTTIHPTRHNPHPHIHDLPHGEDRLLVVTASREVFEFSVLKGQLSDWSRRNPMSRFPEEFRRLRDQAMGCVWDVASSKSNSRSTERVWLYGTNWLWMFDLSQDLPVKASSSTASALLNVNENGNGDAQEDQSRPKKKRRMEKEELVKGTTGAGSKVPDKELQTGMGRSFKKVSFEKKGTGEEIVETRARPEGFEVADEDGMDVDATDLVALRATERSGEEESSGLTNGEVALTNGNGAAHDASSSSRNWWHTYKYRPVMGIVPIEGEGDGLEVVLVERPLWELDLPPRWYGEGEEEKPGL